MRKVISLRARIILILSVLVLTVIGCGVVTIWYAEAIESLFTKVVDKDVTSFRVAVNLETALARQKGFTSYYFMDGNPDWLRQLEQNHQIFNKTLREARESVQTEMGRNILDSIGSEYTLYNDSRRRVIGFYQGGNKEAGFKLHINIRRQFIAIYNLCEQYKGIHEKSIARARNEVLSRTRFNNAMIMVFIQIAGMTGVLLAYILFKQVLEPIRQLTRETLPDDGDRIPSSDEVKTLSHQVYGLIKDVDQTQGRLARSQAHLVQSEKLAMVGKLAAGVAHSIRNPLTSVKIRLFSLGRALSLSAGQKEDLEVISEEIHHIDTILQNFLAFSRPLKPRMEKISPSDVVDLACQLLWHRFESSGVAVEISREKRLPLIPADPYQLKEVLINVLVNACEIMTNGGVIRIEEEEGQGDSGREVIIRVIDNGPGIPEDIQDKVFLPFFSTKEEGTGLGLSIALRIVEEHGGRLDLRSREGDGAHFVITLPCKEKNDGNYPDC
ncbi:MAG: MCP four helix bundle domain-containing protein [Desulfobacterales bacterium]|nr:MCP four helix bundle domain-containing protein [Desulfobacterales bacterium]